MDRDINHMSDVELAFEYRNLYEGGDWNARFKEVEAETQRRAFESSKPKGREALDTRTSEKKPLISRQEAMEIGKQLGINWNVFANMVAEFTTGINTEYGEHKGTIAKLGGNTELAAGMIALDHLNEDPKYYEKLTRSGL